MAFLDITEGIEYTYTYDAWGKCTVVEDNSGCNIANANPFRYRSYYYDTETGLYYLQSRYYDPETGRFINADEAYYAITRSKIIGTNLYCYCHNNMLNKEDRSGNMASYINEQKGSTVVNVCGKNMKMKDIQWGSLGNVAKNGCGIIAAYNVLLHHSSKVNFGNVLADLWTLGGPLGFGKLGLNWPTLTLYLKRKFWFVQTGSSITYLWGLKAETSCCVIVLFKWKGLSGMHFVAGIGTGNWDVGGSFKFYNTFLGVDRKTLSIWDLIDKIKAKGGTPVAFWGVSGKKGWW